MRTTCGTDIIEIDRIKESIENLGEKFVDKIYTKNEIEYCESKKSQKYQHYAARFAAKEAAFKAVSLYLENKQQILWKSFETKNDETGRPYLTINLDLKDNNNIKYVDLSISHCKEYAIATVICQIDVGGADKVEK